MYENIVEVRECGQHNANFYLTNNYVLLDVQQGTYSTRHFTEPAGEHAGGYFVRRNPIYVLGRPEGVESVTPPRRLGRDTVVATQDEVAPVPETPLEAAA